MTTHSTRRVCFNRLPLMGEHMCLCARHILKIRLVYIQHVSMRQTVADVFVRLQRLSVAFFILFARISLCSILRSFFKHCSYAGIDAMNYWRKTASSFSSSKINSYFLPILRGINFPFILFDPCNVSAWISHINCLNAANKSILYSHFLSTPFSTRKFSLHRSHDLWFGQRFYRTGRKCTLKMELH